MFDNYNFYIFILLFLFAVLLNMFTAYIPHSWAVNVFLWILLVIPIFAFGYLMKYQNASVNAFYVMFTSVLVLYVLVFGITKIYPLLQQAGTASQ